MKNYKNVLILAIFLIPLFLFAWNQFVDLGTLVQSPKVKEGVLDLRTWDFDKEGIIKLDGEWDYYAGDFLSLEEIHNVTTIPIQVPSLFKGGGKGTYHLHVELPISPSIYGFKINNIRTAHGLYIDEKLIGGKDLTKPYVAQNMPYATFFYTDKNSLDIIIQMEAKNYKNRGIAQSIYFGQSQSISNLHSKQFGLNLGLIMIMVLFSMYHLLGYVNRKNDPFFLYVGLYFIVLAISASLIGEKIMLQLFPKISFVTAIKMKEIFGFLSMFIIIIVLKKSGFKMRMIKGIPLITIPLIVQILLAVLLPHSIYSNIHYWVWGYVWILLCFILIRMLKLIFKKQLIRINIIEFVLLFLAVGCKTIFIGMEIITSIYPVIILHEVWMFFFILVIFIFIAIKTTNVMNVLEQTRDEAIRTKFSFLNLQIKPHFIYNAISNIISLCYTDSQKAARLLSKFSKYLRMILENNRQNTFITVDKEIELIKAYVEIEKTRLNDRIDIHFTIDENIDHVLIPSLSIQPFVENAIQHGLFNKSSKGNVWITATLVNDYLKVIIEDDGIGMSAEQVLQIENVSDQKGVGIQNVQARLQLIPDSYLKIFAEVDKGTTIVIHLPIKLDRKEE